MLTWIKDRLEEYYASCSDWGETLAATFVLFLYGLIVVLACSMLIAAVIGLAREGLLWVAVLIAGLIVAFLLAAYAAHIRFVDRP